MRHNASVRLASLVLLVASHVTGHVQSQCDTGTLVFPTPLYFDAGDEPAFTAIADLNGDGHSDVLVIQQGAHTIGISLAVGDGTIGSFTELPVLGLARTLTVEDVSGDGVLDLIVPYTNEASVGVAIGRGDGSFNNPVSYDTGLGPYSAAAADLNGDDLPDICTANYLDDSLSILRNQGFGEFLPAVSVDVGDGPYFVVSADFNGDLQDDLGVTTFGDNSFSVLLQTGPASFGPPVVTSVGSRPLFTAVGMFNDDTYDDVAIVNSTTNTISVLLGQADGTFVGESEFAPGSSLGGLRSLAAADLDTDGLDELIITDSSSDSLRIATRDDLTGNWSTTGYRGRSRMTFASGGDVDGDGTPEVLASSTEDDQLAVFSVTDLGLLETLDLVHPFYLSASSSASSGVELVDMNLDLLPDLVVATAFGIAIHLGRSDGAFDDPLLFPSSIVSLEALSVGDIDADGLVDVAATTAGPFGGPIVVYYGSPDSLLTDPLMINVHGEYDTIGIGDVTGDGVANIVVSGYPDISQAPELIVLRRQDNDTFQTAGVASSFASADQMILADANEDGVTDITLINNQIAGARTTFGGSHSTLSQSSFISLGGDPPGSSSSVVTGDVDGDALDELIAWDFALGSGRLTVYDSSPTGYQTAQSITLSETPSPFTTIGLGDVSGDGLRDVILDSGSSTMSIYLNDAKGGWCSPQDYDRLPLSLTDQLLTADLNLDGSIDVLGIDLSRAAIALNLSSGGPVIYAFAGIPESAVEGVATPLAVALNPGNGQTLFTETTTVFYSINTPGQPFLPLFMSTTDDRVYRTELPAASCGDQISFYFAVVDDTLETITLPPDPAAPFIVSVDCVQPSCSADTNGDGQITPADFNAWILAFNSIEEPCDQNGDGFCTPSDFNAWILNYNAGC